VGECWDTASVIASYYASGIPSIFNYPLAQYNGIIVSSVRKLGSANAKTFMNNLMNLYSSYSKNNPDFIDSPFLSNHDNTRISAQCANDPNQMKMAAGVLLTLNGSPFVYYGEEIGMNSKGDKDENKRLPMNWSATDTTGITKAPAGADKVEQKFAPLDEQLQDPLSIVNYYKRALRIRNENPEIARGEVSVVDALTTENVCVVTKEYEGSTIAIVYNMNSEAATVDLKTANLGNMAIRGYLTVDGRVVLLADGVLTLPPYSIVIVK
jgi:glycosidase